jgi:hypothetical protein
VPRHPFSFPNISGGRETTVNQTVRQRQKVIAYFRRPVVQKWGQAYFTFILASHKYAWLELLQSYEFDRIKLSYLHASPSSTKSLEFPGSINRSDGVAFAKSEASLQFVLNASMAFPRISRNFRGTGAATCSQNLYCL